MLSWHRANKRGNNGERLMETAQQSRDAAKSPQGVYRASVFTVDSEIKIAKNIYTVGEITLGEGLFLMFSAQIHWNDNHKYR